MRSSRLSGIAAPQVWQPQPLAAQGGRDSTAAADEKPAGLVISEEEMRRAMGRTIRTAHCAPRTPVRRAHCAVSVVQEDEGSDGANSYKGHDTRRVKDVQIAALILVMLFVVFQVARMHELPQVQLGGKRSGISE